MHGDKKGKPGGGRPRPKDAKGPPAKGGGSKFNPKNAPQKDGAKGVKNFKGKDSGRKPFVKGKKMTTAGDGKVSKGLVGKKRPPSTEDSAAAAGGGKRARVAIMSEAKQIWERLRMKDRHGGTRKPRPGQLPPPGQKERVEMCERLMSMVRGSVPEMAMKPDACRVVQCVLKYGTPALRSEVASEIKGQVQNLSKNIYGQFLMRRVLKFASKAERASILREFHGAVCKLIRHAQASKVLEYAYTEAATAEQRTALVLEFYGPEFTLFPDQVKYTSGAALLAAYPERKKSMLQSLARTLNVVIAKGLVRHSITHRALLDFLSLADAKSVNDSVSNLAESLVHILHTRDGSRAAALALSYSTSKDRKKILKSFKTLVAKICREEYGHIIIVRVFDVLDDTVLVQKVILSEIEADLLGLATDRHGRKPLLHLLSPANPRYFSKEGRDILTPFPHIAALDSEGSSSLPTSKKDTEVRRNELLRFLSPALLALSAENARALLLSREGSDVLRETLLHAAGDRQAAYEAVARVLVSEDSEAKEGDEADGETKTEEPVKEPLVEDGRISRIAKDFVKADTGSEAGSSSFTQVLWEHMQTDLQRWAVHSFASFVIAALLESPQSEVSSQVVKAVKKIEADIQAAEGAGPQLLLKLLKQ